MWLSYSTLLLTEDDWFSHSVVAIHLHATYQYCMSLTVQDLL